MKKILIPCLLLLLFAGCRNDNDQIRSAAQGYLDAMGNYRPTDARPYATEETCNVTLAFFEKMMQFTDPSVYADNIPATISLGEITIEEDSLATIAFHKHTPTKEQDGTIHLLRRNGKWRVHEVIKIPDMLNMPSTPRQLSDEELKELRQNGTKHTDGKMEMKNL